MVDVGATVVVVGATVVVVTSVVVVVGHGTHSLAKGKIKSPSVST